MPTSYDVRPGRLGFLDYVAILVFLVFVVAGVYLFFQNSQAKAEQIKITSETKTVDAQIADLKSRNIEKVALTQKFLSDVEEQEVIWSKVMDLMKRITPEGIVYTAYVGRESKELSLNVETDSVEKVIAAIKSYNGNDQFEDVFIPSVNKGLTLDGERVFTFTINTTYKK